MALPTELIGVLAVAVFASATFKGILETIRSVIRERLAGRDAEHPDTAVVASNIENLKEMSSEIDDLKGRIDQLIESNRELTTSLERTKKGNSASS